MSISAFAAETVVSGSDPAALTPNPATSAVDVVVTDETAIVYNVEIVWGDLTFEYAKGTWQPGSHTYSGLGFATSGEKATTTSADITVKNHSNAQVTYSAEFATGGNTVTDSNGAVTATLTSATTGTLNDAAKEAYNDVSKAPKGTFTVGVAVIDEEALVDVTVGTIEVTIGVPDPDPAG